jgi:hypothetical protein
MTVDRSGVTHSGTQSGTTPFQGSRATVMVVPATGGDDGGEGGTGGDGGDGGDGGG